jgi:hypothetical protein
MKRTLFVCMILLLANVLVSKAQEKEWDFTADLNFFLFEDDFFVIPVFKADHDKLHLEGRYNYEDMETFSGWVGYNMSGGDGLEYTITPMVGGIVGLSNGIAPGLEFTLTLGKFELYNESEYFVDVEDSNHFFYSWTDLTFGLTDSFWFGLSGQRTRLYETDLSFQRGLLVGGAYKKFELNGYVFNAGFDEAFFLVAVTANF